MTLGSPIGCMSRSISTIRGQVLCKEQLFYCIYDGINCECLSICQQQYMCFLMAHTVERKTVVQINMKMFQRNQ